MNRNLQKWLQEAGASRRARKRRLRTLCLILAVTMVATNYALIMPAQTLDGYKCGMDEHAHSVENGCYNENKTLICTEEEGGHVHADSCYEE